MKNLFAATLIAFATVTCLAEESCEPTVDLADSMNVNAKQNCSEEKTGLNRLVHNMFRRNSATSSSASPVADQSSQVSSQISSANELAEVRYQLLIEIGQKCEKGFRLTGEHYLPADGHLRLNLLYECL